MTTTPTHRWTTILPGILLLAVPLLLPGPVRAQHFPADDDLELMLRYLVEDGEAPGVVLGVVEADGSTRVVSYGSAGPDAGPVGAGSVFEIGSITKAFTATLLAEMALRGEVALEDPVAKHLPDRVTVPSRDGREITLLDLATHRSGLPTVPDDMDTPGRKPPSEEYTVEDAYAFLSSYELSRAPGERREYSNFGFGLLAHALGRAAGSDFRELVRARILEPLGMDGTGFTPAGEAGARSTRGHREGEPVRGRTDWEIMDGAGGLRSTAEDLVVYVKAHVGPPGTELAEAMRMAREIRFPRGDGRGGHGLAWATVAFPDEAPVVGHGGGTVGYRARVAFMPDEGIGTVVLANDAFFDDELGTTLLFPDPPPEEWGRVRVARDLLAEYAGEYETASGSGSYHVRLEDDGFLTYQPEEKVRARLYARSDSTFFLLRAPWSFTFRGAADGGVRMVMEVDEREPDQEGTRREARKVGDDTPPPRVVAENAGFWAGWGAGTWVLIGLPGILVAGGLLLAIRRIRSSRAAGTSGGPGHARRNRRGG